MNSTTKNLIYCALFAALTAVFSQIAIPIEPVPVNLALFSVFVAGGLLGAAKGSISQAVYILLGAVGAPVFSNLHGGFQVLIGPTGGYIAGYVVAALAAGIVAERFGRKTIPVIIGCVIGLAACYTIGTVWYCFQSATPFGAALSLCVLPFLPGDTIKIAAAALIVPRLYKAVYKV